MTEYQLGVRVRPSRYPRQLSLLAGQEKPGAVVGTCLALPEPGAGRSYLALSGLFAPEGWELEKPKSQCEEFYRSIQMIDLDRLVISRANVRVVKRDRAADASLAFGMLQCRGTQGI